MSAKDKKLIIILVGFVILALSYFLVFQRAQEKQRQLKSENTTLVQRYQELSELAAKVDQFEADIITMNDEMDKIIAHYPSYLQIEDTIMNVVNIEEETKSRVTSLSVATPFAVDVASGEATPENTVKNTETSTGSSSDSAQADGSTASEGDAAATQSAPVVRDIYQLYNVESTAIIEVGNKGLKKMIEMVACSENKQRVVSVTVSFNKSTGLMDGTIVYDSYFLYGIDKPYESPFIPSTPHGTKNVFGTVGE